MNFREQELIDKVLSGGKKKMARTTRKVLAIATKGYKTKNLYNWEQVMVYQNRGWKIEMA